MGPRTKQYYVNIYDMFIKWLGKTWTAPVYKPIRKLPSIPTENQLDQLIAACRKRLSVFLLLLKETGMRCGEAIRIEWTDVDFQRKLVNITPEKGSNPRLLPISDRLIGMLQKIPKKGSRIWTATLTSLKTNYYVQRRMIANKLNEPALLKISLHSFRHWKATTEYHRTHDIIPVQQLLGHMDIKSIMIYINLERAIFNSSTDQFHVKVAMSSKEAAKLLEVGFDYVLTSADGTMLFRKRR